ncbi:MAG: oligosaccharide flippase family protein [Candidatus Micrarchaeota archaeon]
MKGGEKGEDISGTVAKGAFFKLGSAGFGKVFGLVFTIIVLNFFSAEQSDLFFEANAFVLALTSLAALGLAVAAIKFIPTFLVQKKYGKVKTTVVSAVVALFVVGVLISAGLFLLEEKIVERYGGGMAPILPIVALVSIVLLPLGYLSSVLNAFKAFKEAAISVFLFQILKLLGIGILIYFSLAFAYELMGAFFISYLIVLAYVGWEVIRRLSKLSGETTFSPSVLWKNIKFGFPVYISAIIESFVTQMDVILIGFFLGASPGIVSGYAAVIVFVRNIGPVVSIPISEVQTPILVEQFEKKSEMFGKITKELSRWTVYFGIPVLCVFLVYADSLLGIVANKYKDNAYLMWLFIPMVLAALISTSARSALLARGHVKILLAVSITIVAVNLAVDWTLIPAIGVAGAAIGSSLAATLGEGGAVVAAYKKFGAKLHFDVVKALIAGVVAVGAGFVALPYIGTLSAFATQGVIHLVLGMGISCVIYSVALLLMKGIKRKDWEIGFRLMEKQGFGKYSGYIRPVANIICNYTG